MTNSDVVMLEELTDEKDEFGSDVHVTKDCSRDGFEQTPDVSVCKGAKLFGDDVACISEAEVAMSDCHAQLPEAELAEARVQVAFGGSSGNCASRTRHSAWSLEQICRQFFVRGQPLPQQTQVVLANVVERLVQAVSGQNESPSRAVRGRRSDVNLKDVPMRDLLIDVLRKCPPRMCSPATAHNIASRVVASLWCLPPHWSSG